MCSESQSITTQTTDFQQTSWPPMVISVSNSYAPGSSYSNTISAPTTSLSSNKSTQKSKNNESELNIAFLQRELAAAQTRITQLDTSNDEKQKRITVLLDRIKYLEEKENKSTYDKYFASNGSYAGERLSSNATSSHPNTAHTGPPANCCNAWNHGPPPGHITQSCCFTQAVKNCPHHGSLSSSDQKTLLDALLGSIHLLKDMVESLHIPKTKISNSVDPNPSEPAPNPNPGSSSTRAPTVPSAESSNECLNLWHVSVESTMSHDIYSLN